MRKSLFLSLIALICSVVALVKVYTPAATVAPAATSAGNVDAAAIEEILVNKPEIVMNAMQAYDQKMREQAMVQTREMIKNHSEELNNDKSSPYIGPKDGKLVLVEFYDYACHFCHNLFPELNKVIANNPDVKFVFKPLAFVSPYSDYAGRAAYAAAKQGKFNEMHTALFTVDGALTEDSINALAEKIGLDVEQMKKDIQSQEITDAMESNNKLAATLQINGVPTMILDGDLLQTISGDEIQNKINEKK